MSPPQNSNDWFNRFIIFYKTINVAVVMTTRKHLETIFWDRCFVLIPRGFIHEFEREVAKTSINKYQVEYYQLNQIGKWKKQLEQSPSRNNTKIFIVSQWRRARREELILFSLLRSLCPSGRKYTLPFFLEVEEPQETITWDRQDRNANVSSAFPSNRHPACWTPFNRPSFYTSL